MKFCTNCGSKLSENAKFCTNCGTRFETPKPKAAPAPAPVQPVYEAPKPPVQQPAQPVYEAPKSPVQQPAQPVYEAPKPPVQHVYETPKQPAAYEAPKPPVYQPPVQHGAGNGYVPPVVPNPPKQGESGGKKPIDKRILIIGAGVVAIIAIIAIAIALISGGGSSDDVNLGIYNGTSCIVSGMELGAEGEWVELKAKGKATMFLMNEEYSGKWTLEGEKLTITQAGDEYTGTLSNGVMVIDFAGMQYTFAKEGAVVETEPAVTEPALSEVGLWKMIRVDSDDPASAISEEDMKMLEEMVGMTSILEIKEDGTAVLTFAGEESEHVTWGDGKIIGVDGTPADYTLADGTFSFTIENMTYVFVPAEEGAAPAETTPAQTEATEAATEATEAATQATQASSVSGVIASADIKDYHIDIVGAEEFADADGKTAIRVYYDFYNNSGETTTSSSHLSYLVTQDGYELNTTYTSYDEDVAEYGNSYKNIRPGCAIRCVAEYSMKADGGPLTFTIYDFWDEENALSAEFDPQNLPGRPAEDFVVATVADPQWTAHLVDGGDYVEDTYVYIDSAEIVEGYDGEQLIRVYLEFTNNSSEAQSFWMVGGIDAYQDGIELDTGYPASTMVSDEAYSQDVAPGETVYVSMCFVLRSESIVEVEVVDLWGDLDLGCCFELE